MGLNSYIAKQFSNPSGFGGKIVSAVMNSQNRPMYEETERLLSLSESDFVLDIGCGNGYVLNLLAQRHSCIFTGIDISESAVKSASHRNRKLLKDGKIRLSCQNTPFVVHIAPYFVKYYCATIDIVIIYCYNRSIL